MLELKNMHSSLETDISNGDNVASEPKKSGPRYKSYLLDALVLLSMSIILLYGTSWQFTLTHNDLARYECYATAFWHGIPGLNRLPKSQCSFMLGPTSTGGLIQSLQDHGAPGALVQFIQWQSPQTSFHALPPEYPLATMLPFTLAYFTRFIPYQIAFALWMTLFAVVVYFILKRFKSTGAAIAFAFYLTVGGWSTALGRFDILPAGLTLVALLLAERALWKWAFAVLALATMLKFYPLILLLPFLIGQQMYTKERWLSLQRWSALAIFIGVCAGLTLASLLLSVQGTLTPLGYFSNRPIQVESLSASLLWLGSSLGFAAYPVTSFGSLNVMSRLSPGVGILGMLGLSAGLVATFWLQLRHKIDLLTASLLTLLIVIITGKVFSPQYLIWVIPLLAYKFQTNWKWLMSWGAVGVLTTWVFPFLYRAATTAKLITAEPAFYPVLLTRNLIVLGVIIVLFYQATHATPVEDATTQPLPIEEISPVLISRKTLPLRG